MRRAVNYAIDRRALGASSRSEGAEAGRPTSTSRRAIPGSATRRSTRSAGPTWPPRGAWRGGARRRGVLYTCNGPGCIARAAIVRANLAAIGIELEIRRFSITAMYRRLLNPDEPYDLSLFTWGGEVPDPSEFIEDMFGDGREPRDSSTARVWDSGSAPRAGSPAPSGSRPTPRSTATSRHTAAPFAPYISSYTHADFFSARIGCQVEHPLYGIDLAALCIRN